MINPTGSAGYAKTFRIVFAALGDRNHVVTECIKLMVIDFDLEAGYDYLLAEYDFIDGSRTVALGASYGGYMVSSSL
jgi:dipeptidyl aminopeptidase/acylaminoacyl peptidase